ncbi:MAG: AraC family transcriptional regulator, partial [Bacteroidota bacterium]
MDFLPHFSFNEKSSVLLIAFVHAIIFSALLLKKGLSEQNQASLWLSAFIFLGGLYLCPFMLGYAGWYSDKLGYHEFMFFVPFQQLFLIGPVFYFYVKSLLDRKLSLRKPDLLHFVPALLYAVYSLVVFITDKFILDEFYFYADGRDKDLAFWYQMAGLISMLAYLVMSLRAYFRYRALSLQEVSYADEIAFSWIKHFTMAFGLILVLRVLFFILNPEWGAFGSKYWYYLCFSILLVYISINGFAQTIRATISLRPQLLGSFAPLAQQASPAPDPSPVPEPASTEVLDSWKEKISHLFEAEEVYKKPDLTLTDLASQLETNRNIISKAINQAFGMNFNDFVNQKRAEAVITQLQQGAHHLNTLLGIALDCGFNSKTTFNRAFKKYTGTTPRQFIV